MAFVAEGGFQHSPEVAGQPVKHVQIDQIVTFGHASLKPLKLDLGGRNAAVGDQVLCLITPVNLTAPRSRRKRCWPARLSQRRNDINILYD